MKIVIADIPDEGLSLDIQEKISSPDISLHSPVYARLALNRTGSEIIISGSMDADLEFQCSRCLKDFRRRMEIPVSVVYHSIDELGAERHELQDDELDMGFYAGEELDLQELLKEQILLNLQMKPLCDENCRGICPHCGRDLNKEQCDCGQKEIDSRLEVLKNYLEKRKE